MLLQLIKPPYIRLQVSRVFRVDRVDLAFGAGRVEQWFRKEACKAVECAEECFRRDLESVLGRTLTDGPCHWTTTYVGIAQRGIRIGSATVG